MHRSGSVVVTGAAGGVGRAVCARLQAEGRAVVALDSDARALRELTGELGRSVRALAGDASDVAVCDRAARLAAESAPLAGWVNNAAVFRDAALHDTPAHVVLELIQANVALAVAGASAAVRAFRSARDGGVLITISSHQASRPVRGALPYATAKAAVEGLTRAVAVDHGPDGIRANAIALGTIRTARSADLDDRELAALHPLGRPGEASEVAELVAALLGPAGDFLSGATIPLDGGRAALGLDPEARELT